MIEIRPIWLILGGSGLLVLAVVASFSMLLRVVEPSFLLVFLTYGASLAGLLVGIIGVAMYSGWRRG